MMQLKLKPISAISTFLAVLSFAVPGTSRAACHVITHTGGGTNSGADWNNPCNGFSGNCAGSAMKRGDVYYVAGGAGGSYTNSANAPVLRVTTPVSGTALITIKAATIADHCTATGYVQANVAVDGGAGQADFVTAGNGVFEAATSYVVFDGNFSASDTSSAWGNPGHACAGTQCGILSNQRVVSPVSASSLSTYGVYIDANVTNVTVRSIEFAGAWSTAGNLGIGTDFIRTPSGGSGMLFTHNYLHDSSQAYFQIYGSNGTVISYNYMYKNYSHVTSPAVHGSCVEMSGNTNLSFAFNAVQDSQGTACVSELSSGLTSSSGVMVYGNLFWMTIGNPNGLAGGYDNGIVSCTNGQLCTGWKVYNNTIVNESISTNNSLNGGNPVGSGSSIAVYNNLFYNSAGANNQCTHWTGSCVYDYNSYYGTTQNTPGAHDVTAPANLFVNLAVSNFHLTTDQSAWYSLGSPFNMDMDGVGRNSSRGAFQYVSGTSATTAPPSSLTATVQ